MDHNSNNMEYSVFRNHIGQFNPDAAAEQRYVVALFAQAIHETGTFTSDLCTNHNNLYGMKKSGGGRNQGSFTNEFTPSGFAKYPSKAFSIGDRLDLDDNFGRSCQISSPQEMCVYMLEVQNGGYAEETDYVIIWFKVLRQLYPNAVEGLTHNQMEIMTNCLGSGRGSMDRYIEAFEENRGAPAQGMFGQILAGIGNIFKSSGTIGGGLLILGGYLLYRKYGRN